jgi:phosphoribosyl-ATP pyrophosphohydrolase/phosphoribosyl-AMP cyclohydrolase/histidinol dehydrogenase
MAAAAVAGADGLLAVGGVQAIGALAFGAGVVPRCDVVVGPGNRWVTAAKKLIAGETGIDFLAGPSELAVLADATARPDIVAADLLAQAEHDPDALPLLITTDADFAAAVDAELAAQLADLPTAETARAALANGFTVVAPDLAAACRVANELAPEHLEVHVADIATARRLLGDFGGVFLGATAAEVFGDYGAGPNHVLPTGGTARFTGGLSVYHFLAVRTFLELDSPDHAGESTRAELGALASDTARLARLEGLEAHARAAEMRRPYPSR